MACTAAPYAGAPGRAIRWTNGVTEGERPGRHASGAACHRSSGLAVTSVAAYDVSTMPEGGDRPWFVGLVCKTLPGAQPGGGLPSVPTTTRLYNRLGLVTVETDALAGGGSRVATTGYDPAGRQITAGVAASAGVADAVPIASQAYDPGTGLPTTTTAGGKTLTKVYDGLGRMTGYTDADGVTSTTSYDGRGRVSHTDDGKGTQDLGYDATSDQLTTLTDSAAGVFTAGYDADGRMVQQAYPNGLQATTVYDETGDPTRLQYVKTTNCSSSCTWLEEQVDSSIHGQWLHRTSTLSGQDYAYDQAGRLTRVDDTDIKGNEPCTQRRYGYSADSNRTGQVAGASCADGSGGTSTSHAYDEADRLTDTGTGYDKLGNTTALAASNAGGYAITSTYYADDRLHTQAQNGVTETQELDPARRIRQLTIAGQSTRVDIYHYSDDSDSPAWISSAPGSWSRNIQGPGGDLAATQDGATGTVTLQLANLHGDITATATTSPTATGPTGTQEQTEFGEPRTPNPTRYGYLGAKQRERTSPTGTIQMGQRTYIPQTGRFLQTDPIPEGSANNYDYTNQDPINQTDLKGTAVRCSFDAVDRPSGFAGFGYFSITVTVHAALRCRGGSARNIRVSVHITGGFVQGPAIAFGLVGIPPGTVGSCRKGTGRFCYAGSVTHRTVFPAGCGPYAGLVHYRASATYYLGRRRRHLGIAPNSVAAFHGTYCTE